MWHDEGDLTPSERVALRVALWIGILGWALCVAGVMFALTLPSPVVSGA